MHPRSPRANPIPRVVASLSRLSAPCSSQKSALLSVRLELSACGGAGRRSPCRAPRPGFAPGPANSRRSSLQPPSSWVRATRRTERPQAGWPQPQRQWGACGRAARVGPETLSALVHFSSPRVSLSSVVFFQAHSSYPGSSVLFTQFHSLDWKSPNASPLCSQGTEQNSQQTGFYFSQPLKANK